jgi:DNA primase
MNIQVVQLQQGKDPDEIIRKNPLEWKKAIKGSVPIYDFFIDSAVNKFGSGAAEAKKRVAAAVLPEIAKISDEIVKAHYFQALSSKLGVEEVVLRIAARKYESRQPETVDIKEILDKPLSEKGKVLVEKYLLALIIQSAQFPKDVDEKLIDEPRIKEIFTKIKQFVEKEGRLKVKSFLKTIPTALLPVFDGLVLHEINEDLLGDEEGTLKEMKYCVSRLKELNLRTKLKELALAIRQAESAGNQSRVGSLSEQFRDLSKALNSLEVR